MPTVEELRLIHTNPIVRFVWSHLRLMKQAGHDDPQNEPLTRAGMKEIEAAAGVELFPSNDSWWR